MRRVRMSTVYHFSERVAHRCAFSLHAYNAALRGQPAATSPPTQASMRRETTIAEGGTDEISDATSLSFIYASGELLFGRLHL